MLTSYERAMVPYVGGGGAGGVGGAGAVLPLGNAPPPGGVGLLPVRSQAAVLPLVHNDLQRRLLLLPGRDVPYVWGRISGHQVLTHRPSYINAVLIQRAGVLVPGGGCTACRTRPGLTPFTDCFRAPGHFGGACGNCKWRDYAARCSVRDTNLPAIQGTGNDNAGGSGGQAQLPGATPGNAIVLA